jgi:hypothetical protein
MTHGRGGAPPAAPLRPFTTEDPMSDARDPQPAPQPPQDPAADGAELSADTLEAVSGGVIDGGCTEPRLPGSGDSEWCQHGGGACSCCL